MIAPAHFEQAFPGDPTSVGQARAFVTEALAKVPTVAEDVRQDAELCVSELATNAVRHTASGAPGGKYRVIVEAGPGDRAHVEVIDQGAEGVPAVLLGGIETGRGLWTCACLGVLTYSPASGGRRVAVDLPHPTGAAVDPSAPSVVLAHPHDGSDQR